jgi:fructose-specific phosphotransferase system IIA component
LAAATSAMISIDRIIDLKGETKSAVLNELIDVMATSPMVSDAEDLRRRLLERESTHSTGIGMGVALPHAKISSVKDFVIAIGRTTAGVDFDALDGKPVYIVVMISCHESQSGEFLKVMARFVKALKDKEFRRTILLAKSPEEISTIFVDGTRS